MSNLWVSQASASPLEAPAAEAARQTRGHPGLALLLTQDDSSQGQIFHDQGSKLSHQFGCVDRLFLCLRLPRWFPASRARGTATAQREDGHDQGNLLSAACWAQMKKSRHFFQWISGTMRDTIQSHWCPEFQLAARSLRSQLGQLFWTRN